MEFYAAEKIEVPFDDKKEITPDNAPNCICCYCSELNQKVCDRSCCKTGIPCANFNKGPTRPRDEF